MNLATQRRVEDTRTAVRRGRETPMRSQERIDRSPATATNLGQKILDKLYMGILPDRLLEKVGGGFGGGHTCDGCDGPILLGQAEYTYELSDRVLRLHIRCAGVWQAELRRRGSETRSVTDGA